MNETEMVYGAKLKAKQRLIAKYGETEQVLRTILEVAGV